MIAGLSKSITHCKVTLLLIFHTLFNTSFAIFTVRKRNSRNAWIKQQVNAAKRLQNFLKAITSLASLVHATTARLRKETQTSVVRTIATMGHLLLLKQVLNCQHYLLFCVGSLFTNLDISYVYEEHSEQLQKLKESKMLNCN